MMNNMSMEGDYEVSGSSAVSAGHLLQNLHMLEEGTHRRGELRSCYISNPFAKDRHSHFRDFKAAQQGLSSSSSSSSSHIVPDTKDNSSVYHHRSGAASGVSAVLNQQESQATKDQSAAACPNSASSLKQSVDIDLVRSLQSCHICGPSSPSSSPTSFDGMEQDVPPHPQHAHLHRHHNPGGLGHYSSARSLDKPLTDDYQSEVPSHLDLMQT